LNEKNWRLISIVIVLEYTTNKIFDIRKVPKNCVPHRYKLEKKTTKKKSLLRKVESRIKAAEREEQNCIPIFFSNPNSKIRLRQSSFSIRR